MYCIVCFESYIYIAIMKQQSIDNNYLMSSYWNCWLQASDTIGDVLFCSKNIVIIIIYQYQIPVAVAGVGIIRTVAGK